MKPQTNRQPTAVALEFDIAHQWKAVIRWRNKRQIVAGWYATSDDAHRGAQQALAVAQQIGYIPKRAKVSARLFRLDAEPA